MSNLNEVPYREAFLSNLVLFGLVVSEEMHFFESANQKEEFPIVAISIYGSAENEQSL